MDFEIWHWGQKSKLLLWYYCSVQNSAVLYYYTVQNSAVLYYYTVQNSAVLYTSIVLWYRTVQICTVCFSSIPVQNSLLVHVYSMIQYSTILIVQYFSHFCVLTQEYFFHFFHSNLTLQSMPMPINDVALCLKPATEKALKQVCIQHVSPQTKKGLLTKCFIS